MRIRSLLAVMMLVSAEAFGADGDASPTPTAGTPSAVIARCAKRLVPNPQYSEGSTLPGPIRRYRFKAEISAVISNPGAPFEGMIYYQAPYHGPARVNVGTGDTNFNGQAWVNSEEDRVSISLSRGGNPISGPVQCK